MMIWIMKKMNIMEFKKTKKMIYKKKTKKMIYIKN